MASLGHNELIMVDKILWHFWVLMIMAIAYIGHLGICSNHPSLFFCSLPEKSQLLWSCEAELQELMRQIDIMVQQKKSTWDRERQSLEARLEIREQEYSLQKATLEQKHGEVRF